ncbi:hypothetical protein C8Q76DRAFT_798419 [Earliella scabrosa]|nr:hypothetical protein C8Q76DRAFT_798419 [Earliella scabrosa]
MSRVFAILAILAIAVVSPVAAGPIRRDTDSEASPVPAVPTPVFTFKPHTEPRPTSTRNGIPLEMDWLS